MNEILERLYAMQDLSYRDFHSKLMPTVEKARIIGVRTPDLRKYAKEIYGSETAEVFLKTLPHQYYEENNLHGMLLELRKDYKQCVFELDRFLPYVDNWATCDLMSPKIFKKHLPKLIEQVKHWLQSDSTYTVRFGIGMLLKFYLDEEFDREYLELVTLVRSEEYYVKMMVAWYFATALAKQYEAALPYLQEERLDLWCHNKTIQKAVESYRITAEQKDYLKSLKR